MDQRIFAPPRERSSVQLDDVPSTLLIPLAARAFGDDMFPNFAVGDAYAEPALRKMGVDVSPYLHDKPSVFGVLSRTQVLRRLALDFFEQHPYAIAANLGCGLTHYFQWLDNHSNHWLDADVAQVMRLRKRLLPSSGKRHQNATVDLRTPGWWQRLGLPNASSEVPVLVICEGVLMYLEAHEVERVLREFGQNAPAGSEMLFDTLSWLAIGCAAMHPSVCHTHAEFKWGSKHLNDFTAPHPRLRLRSEHAVMDGYDFSTALACSSFRALWGVPLYGIVRIGVED
jgi:O-methyltransferase involved in polyketide biosynthesis